jgi:DUF1680 family protein
MNRDEVRNRITRRGFFAAAAAAGAAGSARAADAHTQQSPPTARPEAAPQETFHRQDLALKAQPFPMTQVRLLDGPFRDAQEANRKFLHRLPADRLLHTFRLNAGLPSSAEPLGGWEKPDVELRGHFTGHYLSACALAYSSTGDSALRDKASGMVAELAKCQDALKGGYLSAFPLEFWDRLKARKKVWAPFYTIHKIMAGMLDMYQHCGNKQALEVLEGMAGWADRLTEPLGEQLMQEVLNTEFGGMNEVLYNLCAVTGKERYAEVAQRFDHRKIYDPLALRRDELKGLHVNTQVPKIIGAARRYELTGQRRYHDIADYFWYEVTSARSYCTGGTSNAEAWLTDPLKLAEELARSSNTNECCVAYNMLKLTRRLYQWTADPRYFDYYERTLFNHRLGTIHPETGGSMYYLPLQSGSWKVFGTDFDSFWCCTGTGVEEFAKANDSIYFHDDEGIFVNLFMASELNWQQKGLRLRQETKFPEQQGTSLVIQAAQPTRMTLRIRIPCWLERGGKASVNGAPVAGFAGPGGYLVISRIWRNGDRVQVSLPMKLYAWPMPDDAGLQAIMYGPLVLVGKLGPAPKEAMFGRMGPDLKGQKLSLPAFKAAAADPASWIKPVAGQPLTFQTAGQKQNVTLVPFYKVYDQRYAVYWRIQQPAA